MLTWKDFMVLIGQIKRNHLIWGFSSAKCENFNTRNVNFPRNPRRKQFKLDLRKNILRLCENIILSKKKKKTVFVNCFENGVAWGKGACSLGSRWRVTVSQETESKSSRPAFSKFHRKRQAGSLGQVGWPNIWNVFGPSPLPAWPGPWLLCQSLKTSLLVTPPIHCLDSFL